MSNSTNENVGLDEIDRELLGELDSNEDAECDEIPDWYEDSQFHEDAGSEDGNCHIAPANSCRLQNDDDDDLELSDSWESIATDEEMEEETDEFADLSQVYVAEKEEEDDAPLPEVTPEQAARICARPRQALRRPGATAPAPQQPPPLRDISQSSLSLVPESTAEPPKDKGKGKEVLFVVPAHGRPLPTDQGVTKLEELKQQLAAERPNQQATAMFVQEQTMRELVSAHLHGEAMRQSRMRLLREQRSRSSTSMNKIDSVSGLTDGLSALRIQPESKNRAAAPQQQQILANLQTSNDHLRKELANEKAANKTLQQSLADCQASQASQAEDCAARLQDLEARLKQEQTTALAAQKVRMVDELKKAVNDSDAEMRAALARATAEAVEKKRLAEVAVADLKKDMEACHAKLERQQKASQVARGTIQSLEGRERALMAEKSTLIEAKKILEADLTRRNIAHRNNVSVLETQRIRADKRARVAMGQAEDMAQAKAAVEAEVRSLRTASRALGADNRKLEKIARTATADLTASFPELSYHQALSNHLTAKLEVKDRRLAGYEAVRQKEGATARELEDLVEEWLEERLVPAVVEEEETGEKEMDALLGEPERAKEGLLRPQFPRWKELLWLLVGLLFLVGSVVAFSAASAATKGRQMWLGRGGEAIRGAVDGGPGSWRQDPLSDLSAGMYNT